MSQFSKECLLEISTGFCMLCSFITQDLLLKNIIKRLVVLKKRRKKRMIQVTLYISFWCNLATPCEYVSFMYLNQPAQKSNEICITSTSSHARGWVLYRLVVSPF